MDKIKLPQFDTPDDISKFIEQTLDEIRSDIEVYEIIKSMNVKTSVVRENVSKFLAFKDDFNYCKNCPGIENCHKATPHLKLSLKYDGISVEREFTPCDKILKKIEIDNMYVVEDFPIEWRESSLSKIDITMERRAAIVEFSNILQGKSTRWLYIEGKHRVGKSFLLATFANEWVNTKKEQVAFINTQNYLKEMHSLSIEQKDKFSKKMVEISSIPLLIFDDFGNEFKSDYERDNVLIPILNERAKNNRLTFFSSEFTIKDIEDMYSINVSSRPRARQLSRLLSDMSGGEILLNAVALY
jgi:primosomal protein DnaI